VQLEKEQGRTDALARSRSLFLNQQIDKLNFKLNSPQSSNIYKQPEHEIINEFQKKIKQLTEK